MNKNLESLLLLMDKSVKVYDWLRLKSNEGPIDEAWEIRDGLFQLFLESYNKDENYQLIYATEDCIIHPGDTKEVKTNISQLIDEKSIEDNQELEFTNEGIISTHGYLSFVLEKNYEIGNKIFVTNNVPKEVDEKYDLCGYHYCDPTITQYFPPGIYRIEEGTIIGIAGIHKEIKSKLQILDRVKHDIDRITATSKRLDKRLRR